MPPGVVGIVVRTGNDSSFDGGTGGDSIPPEVPPNDTDPTPSPPSSAKLLLADPNGPSGSSSTACRRVGWATSLRGVMREGRAPDEDMVEVGVKEGGLSGPAGEIVGPSSSWGFVAEVDD